MNKTAVNWASMVNEIVPMYKNGKRIPVEVPSIKQSDTAASIIRDKYLANNLLINDLEYFTCLFLNRANKVIGWQVMSYGGMTGAVADIRVIFKCALLVGACGIILSHNHPSGNLQPSESDRQMTTKFVEAGNLMDIRVLDHIIITSEGHYSFSENGVI